MTYAIPVERGCGGRVAGGCYFECGIGPGGRPVEDFLYDPPILVPSNLNVSARGVTLIERNGVWHIVDRVGMEHYPNVADFVEEVRRFGLSRRLPSNLDFSKLTAESKIMLVHDRAYIENCHEYQDWDCPKVKIQHDPAFDGMEATMCAGVWWRDVEGGEPASRFAGDARRVVRRMPSFVYVAGCRPDGVTPLYRQAFFAAFPATRLVVVRGDQAPANLEKARKSGLQVDEVDE